jgi:hypothetical protein
VVPQNLKNPTMIRPLLLQRRLPLVLRRGLAMKRREQHWDEPMPAGYTLDSVKPKTHEDGVTQHLPKRDPGPAANLAAARNPVTSAHAIDGNKVSVRDSAALSPNGTVVHGRYGDLGPDVAQNIPLEYLALLRPAAEGAAVVRALNPKTKGTMLVYGASQPAALSAVQLAATSGHAVVAVVGGEHAGNREMLDVVKNLTPEPGFAVAEEYAMVKKNFAELIDATVNGEPEERRDSEKYLKEFKANLLEYADMFPETRPAAVDADMVEFQGQERDRENFRDNIDPYLQQNFPAGSPPFDPARLEKDFTKDQYAIFKSKFHEQTTAVITGDEKGNSFDAPQLVHTLMRSPESIPETKFEPDDIQYEFSIFKPAKGVPPAKGGPIVGAVISVTPGLEAAAKVVEEAGPSLRAKAEALQFLTATQRNAYSAAMSVINHAKKAGAPVYAVGGKSEYEERCIICC